MAIQKSSKGKKRAIEDSISESGLSSLSSESPPPQRPPTKKSKRAETKQCPVCHELIPIRLLGSHFRLELERVEIIIKSVGSTEIAIDDQEEGPSSRSRRAAVKARKSLSAMNPRGNLLDTLELCEKAIQTIKRHRKQRHSKLREMAREEEEGVRQTTWLSGSLGGEISCPVCLQTVRGDQDVLEAHVDSCLAYEGQRILGEQVIEETWEPAVGEGIDDRIGNVSNLRGAGFHLRNRNEQDVEDEVDVDGDDEAVFGHAQFTEGDILGPASDLPQQSGDAQDLEVEIEREGDEEAQREQKTLRDLVAEGKVVSRRSPEEWVGAVKANVEGVMGVAHFTNANSQKPMSVTSSTSLLCRICLDPYSEPTVSTGCWHTCCRECWLRCLGSTKLCPICKRITNATDLRRIYL